MTANAGTERATPAGAARAGVAEQTTGWRPQGPVSTPHPIKAPSALLRERAACPTLQACRNALRHAYAALEWAKKERLDMARQMLHSVRAITTDAINWAAARYHVSATDMIQVGRCESHLWPFATNGQYAGWAQLSTRHREDPIFRVVPWQDAYAEASHVARYVRAHGWGEWQCQPGGGLRW